MTNRSTRQGALALAPLFLAPALLALGSCGTTEPVDASEGPAQADTAEMNDAPALPENSVYKLSAKTLAGEDIDLSAHAGKVTVFVNVASKCGYTPQYTDLQKLHEDLGGADFAVVGIPSNDFGGQEPGTADEIAAFCQENYGVTFAMLEKQSTKEGASPLFDRLAALSDGSRPGWNFCKYVVSKDGASAEFFESSAKPTGSELKGAIDKFKAM